MTTAKKIASERFFFFIPDSQFRQYWDLKQVIMIAYVGTVTPYREAFDTTVRFPVDFTLNCDCCSTFLRLFATEFGQFLTQVTPWSGPFWIDVVRKMMNFAFKTRNCVFKRGIVYQKREIVYQKRGMFF